MFQNARKCVVQHRKMVNMSIDSIYTETIYDMSHQNRILHSSWLTSRNATPSIGSLYKLPTLSAPFLFCDVIADKVYTKMASGVVEDREEGSDPGQIKKELLEELACPFCRELKKIPRSKSKRGKITEAR